MRDFIITTDANSDMPEEYIAKYNTTILPLYYSFGSTLYGDELQMPPSEFYLRMKNGELPQSQPNNPEVIDDKFRAILEEGKDIIHVGFSSALSKSYENVCYVSKNLMERYPGSKITVIDSLNVSLAQTIMVIHANNLKEKGSSYDDIVADLENFKHHVNVQFTVNDLFHLQRGGRVSKATAIVGSVLGLKPSLYVSDTGELSSAGTVRGRKNAINALVDRMLESLSSDTDYSLPVGISHGCCLEEAEQLAESIKQRSQFKEVIISDINPSIGTHSGPGALALAFYGQNKPAKQ